MKVSELHYNMEREAIRAAPTLEERDEAVENVSKSEDELAVPNAAL